MKVINCFIIWHILYVSFTLKISFYHDVFFGLAWWKTSREVNITFYQRTLLGTSANQKRHYLKSYNNENYCINFIFVPNIHIQCARCYLRYSFLFCFTNSKQTKNHATVWMWKVTWYWVIIVIPFTIFNILNIKLLTCFNRSIHTGFCIWLYFYNVYDCRWIYLRFICFEILICSGE